MKHYHFTYFYSYILKNNQNCVNPIVVDFSRILISSINQSSAYYLVKHKKAVGNTDGFSYQILHTNYCLKELSMVAIALLLLAAHCLEYGPRCPSRRYGRGQQAGCRLVA